jgi:iron-sulfur cluster assembly accessory protein
MAIADLPLTDTDTELTETDQITVTDGAIARIRGMIQEKQLTGYALRVFVSGGGCSGMQYGMGMEPEPREDDLRYRFDDVEVVVDPMSISYLAGSVIDYVDDLMAGGFKIENPNAVAACGCGHSFRTEGSSHTDAQSAGCC